MTDIVQGATGTTPGPWKARRVYSQQWSIDFDGKEPTLGYSGWSGLANVYGCDEHGYRDAGEAVGFANAHQIAASPLMYAALQVAADLCVGTFAEGGTPHKQILAALAAARGGVA